MPSLLSRGGALAALAALLSGCSGASSGVPAAPPASGMLSAGPAHPEGVRARSGLSAAAKITSIGSTVDPTTGDQNPYGLTIAPITSGLFTAGDLVACDFNNSSNVQGTGTSIIGLHPTPGSTPTHIISDISLEGCSALADGPADDIWAASWSWNDNPIVSASGQLESTLGNGPWNGPWGQIFSPTAGPFGVAAFYATNAPPSSGPGNLVRINITQSGNFTFDVIATGFPVNHGKPGSILAPSGLTYDANGDVLYVVDGQNNAIYAIDKVSACPAKGLTIKGDKITGSYAKNARLLYSGAPLQWPISAALLANGDLVVGNTQNKNLLIEISTGTKGKVVSKLNVDKGASGAIFGIVATTDSNNNQLIYFNDDNDNSVKVVTP